MLLDKHSGAGGNMAAQALSQSAIEGYMWLEGRAGALAAVELWVAPTYIPF
jgi:hypothetical protein